MDHRLRPATPGDRASLLAVYASTRTDELALTGWPPAQCQAFITMQFDAQWRHYSQHHPQALCQLIVADGAAAGTCLGRLWVDRGADRLHVLDISLLPTARGQGIGSTLLRQLMAEAQQRGVALTISVEVHNPARRLYARLGFQPRGEPQGIHQRMAWQPAALCVTQPQECLP